MVRSRSVANATNRTALFQVQRHERLLNELRRCGAVRVSDLARDLGVSELTIRRDITALAARNLCHRVHGGATLPSRPPSADKPGRKTAFTIGMVVPSLDFYWPPIVAGARAAGAALGVNVQLRGSSYDPEEDRRQIGRLVDAGQVQGLLLAPSLDGEDAGRMLDWISRLPVPTILVERQPRRWTSAPRQIEWVRTDHALGLEIAVHHLHEQGHRRIGLQLSGGSPTSMYLLEGWQRACADLGIPGDAVNTGLVRAGLKGLTALIVHSDPQAIVIARNAADQGIRVPDDLAIVSYDDEVAHLADPPLTAIRPPKNHVGRLAVELMVSRLLDGDKRPVQGVLVAPDLVVRQSSLSRRIRV